MRRKGSPLAVALVAGIVALATGLAGPARAEYPDKAIRFFVPFPAGGSTDAVARAMQPALEKILGQTVVVENRAGAGGMLGVDAVAKAPPDGYTIGIAGAGALGVNIGRRTKRMYDPFKDLAPISRAAESPFILVANPGVKAQTIADVIKLAKAQPNTLSIGHGGDGTAMQLAALMFVTFADVKMNLVPYRGTAPAVTDAIAGHVPFSIADPTPSMGAIKEGKLRALAVSSKNRFAVFPDVPTFEELGLKDFELTGWFGVVAPGATPKPILAKLNAAVVAALKDPEVVHRIHLVGMEPTPTTPEAMMSYLQSDIAKAAKVAPVVDTPN
jgi:tripartite-type tricarboxylate transporter receptor subunit TctC